MNDPHVQSLNYMVSSGEEITYQDPKPILFTNNLGTFELSDGHLRIEPADHYPDEDDYRQIIEPFLRAWEIEADLNSKIGMIRFNFDRAEVIDLNPPPPGSSQVIQVKAAEFVLVGESVSFHLTKKNYPQPPITFRVTPEVEQAYHRWVGYRNGREPLLSMAYFILTLIESMAGNRDGAANLFQIDIQVLRMIGRLSSTKGDASIARKVSTNIQLEELSSSETHWLEETIRKIILRLGEQASGTQLSQISINDLPPL